MTTTKVDFEGTISHGTMRPSDLIERFMPILDRFDPETATKLRKSLFDNVIGITDGGGSYNEFDLSEFLNEDVWPAMDDLAPEGYYFGALEGDGSDYGYWRCSDDPDIEVSVAN